MHTSLIPISVGFVLSGAIHLICSSLIWKPVFYLYLIKAKICIRRQYFPYSLRLFKDGGIKPDIQIERTLDSYINNYDNVLMEGVNILKKKIIK